MRVVLNLAFGKILVDAFSYLLVGLLYKIFHSILLRCVYMVAMAIAL